MTKGPLSSGDPEEDLLKLTPKQRIYVESRIAGMTVGQSAAAAGFKNHSNLESNPRIAQILLHANKQALTRLTLNREDVLSGFMDAVNAAASSTELVMAWREIGKVIGAYEPEVKIQVSVDLTAERIASMGDDALLRLSGMEDFVNPDMEEDIIEGECQVLRSEDEGRGLGTAAIDPSPTDDDADIKADILRDESGD